MNISYTKHAKVRMAQREIAEETIESLIDNPNIIRESVKERIVARKVFPKGTLEVIYKKSFDKVVVITCYWIKGE